MARGRPLPRLELSAAERDQLQAWARGSKTSQALALRARIVLACAAAHCNHEVARTCNVTPQTVGKWRARFLAKRLQGLIDEPRPGAPRKLGDAEMARLLTTALGGDARRDGRRWSSRALAAQVGVSQSTVSRVLRGMGLEPETAEAFRLSMDPHYIDRVRDIVGLYIDAPVRAVVLCIDDRRPCDPVPRWPPAVPLLPPRHALAYPRYEDTTLLEALDRAACGAVGDATRGAGLRPFLDFLRAVDEAVPAERSVHVVMDDKGRRKRATVGRWFQRKPRFRLAAAPSCDAWMAQVERWFALLAAAPSVPGREPATAGLEQAMRVYLQRASSAPFAWIKREPEALQGVASAATS